MDEIYQFKTSPTAKAKCLILGEKYRISVLTGKMIRLEYNKNGIFEDGATQKVINRNFKVPKFRVIESEEYIDVITDYLQLTYDRKEFTENGLSIRLNRNTYSNNSIWHYKEKGENLKGTARTLDEAEGEVELEDGILARNGYSILEDSKSFIIKEDGWVRPPHPGHIDFYFLGYGHNYLECLGDFYHLCGKTPLLPRYALGNWWSRYHNYTQKEYTQLMDRFAKEGLPFSVAVFDMDWHYVNLDEKYGSGWTGFSWNKELFPNHKEMLTKLRSKGMHITLNLHPGDGVRGHEDAYESMAKALGVDYENEVPISFDIADPKFLSAYFTYLHYPLEEEGVDFWWVDWQQGKTTKIPGLDPLWILNHYYYLDNSKNGKRPLIFSRYAGIGSHRYPIGFSGDTIISWKTLQFQPYFTATASNAGYGWWSHDIGGHMNGYRDDELATRWLQYGVFSPIMRLHSSSNLFTGKEPWKFGNDERQIMNRFLKLRHKLIPYLYTMNARFHDDNKPLIQPMYYQYCDQREAYEVPNQYFFGSELIVNPITTKMDTVVKAGKVKTWLPEGMWFDFFSGLRYTGGRNIMMYRGLDNIPVLAKAGAIIPMQKEDTISSCTDNPREIELSVFAGADGEFVMYEDDGISMEYENQKHALTKYALSWNNLKCLTIYPAQGELSCIPQLRNYQVKIFGVPDNCVERILIDGVEVDSRLSYDVKRCLQIVELEELDVNSRLEVILGATIELAENQIQWRVYEAINCAQIDYRIKEQLYQVVLCADSIESTISELNSLETSYHMKELLQEMVLSVKR